MISRHVFALLGLTLLSLEQLEVRTAAGHRLPYLGMVKIEMIGERAQ